MLHHSVSVCVSLSSIPALFVLQISVLDQGIDLSSCLVNSMWLCLLTLLNTLPHLSHNLHHTRHSVHLLPLVKAHLCLPLRKVTGQVVTRLHPISVTLMMTPSKGHSWNQSKVKPDLVLPVQGKVNGSSTRARRSYPATSEDDEGPHIVSSSYSSSWPDHSKALEGQG